MFCSGLLLFRSDSAETWWNRLRSGWHPRYESEMLATENWDKRSGGCAHLENEALYILYASSGHVSVQKSWTRCSQIIKSADRGRVDKMVCNLARRRRAFVTQPLVPSVAQKNSPWQKNAWTGVQKPTRS